MRIELGGKTRTISSTHTDWWQREEWATALVAQQLGFGVERGKERTNTESLRETGLGTGED